MPYWIGVVVVVGNNSNVLLLFARGIARCAAASGGTLNNAGAAWRRYILYFVAIWWLWTLLWLRVRYAARRDVGGDVTRRAANRHDARHGVRRDGRICCWRSDARGAALPFLPGRRPWDLRHCLSRVYQLRRASAYTYRLLYYL